MTQAGRERGPYMQVLVCTCGEQGLRRLAAHSYPAVEDMEYLVSWQVPDTTCCPPIPESLASRPDMRIVPVAGRGLSRNRNEALRLASAPVCLIADDDLHYDPEALRALMRHHRAHPDHDLVCAHITVGGVPPSNYRPGTFPLRRPPRGYYYISGEISFKLLPVRHAGVYFEPLMGVGSDELPCGEEEAFMLSLLRNGLRGVCIPLTIADHPAVSTTGDRILRTGAMARVWGALLRLKHPHSWALRLLPGALFTSRHTDCSYPRAIGQMLRGARFSARHGMFVYPHENSPLQ